MRTKFCKQISKDDKLYQLAEIYCTTQQNISQHVDNIYKDGELTIEATNKKFLLVRKEGNRQVKRNIDHYNLDMIIALGYRVQSLIRIIFCRLPLDYNSWWYHSSRRELPNMVTLFLCRHLLVGKAKDVSMDYLWWLICLETCSALSPGSILIYNLIFPKNRQPSGCGCGSGWYTGASAFICALKPSGNCLDGWRIRGRNRMEVDGLPYYCLVRLLHAI